jgi:alpha-N-arabinofuranosidase
MNKKLGEIVRYSFIAITFSMIASCGGSSPNSSPGNDVNTSLAANISVDIAGVGTSSNRAILGNNIEWVNNGDGIVSTAGLQQSSVVNAVKQLGPSVLRYPGGSLADTYHWQDGIGSLGSRGFDRDLANNYQQVIFGTDEFLQLSSDLGATSLFTVNVITASAQESANWVAYVNSVSERVQYWEIGNEPYLIEDMRPDLAVTPTMFAHNADLAIGAMKNVDPKIKVGLPLRSNMIGSIAATPYPGYNDTVLAEVTNRIDFVSVHNAYFPFTFTTSSVSDQDLYLSAMAASSFMAADLDATAAQVKSLRPESALPIAVTEYNALFGLSTSALQQKSSSLAGALYVADVLRVLANRNDILFADFWSLSGNGYFGIVDEFGNPRPSYYVLLSYNRLLQGQVILAQTNSPIFSNPQVGAVPASTTSVIAATATRSNKTLRLAVINKHSSSHVNLSLKLTNGAAAGGTAYWQLAGAEFFSGAQGYSAISWTSGTVTSIGSNLMFDLPPHSFTLYEIPLF